MKLDYVDFEIASKRSLEITKSVEKFEIISIFDSLNRVLADDIKASKNLPSFNNSAMDGYAFYLDESLNIEDLKEYKIVDTIFAGDKKEPKNLEKNECYKIMTGAKVPQSANTIVPFELCETIDDFSVKIPQNIKKGSNLRLKGEEVKKDEILFKKGHKIDSSTISLLASQGITMLEVYENIKIAIISSGNELKEPWEKADEDEIYNINALAISSFLKEQGFSSSYCGVIPDDLEKSTKFIKSLEDYDLIISSGGISMGEADFLADAFKENGLDIAYHGVNLKPGRAMMVGKLKKAILVSLPGNPLAAIINSYLFLKPILQKLQGSTKIYPDFIELENLEEFRVKENRVEAVLGKIEASKFLVANNNKYGSGMISILNKNNALFISNGNNTIVEKSKKIKVLPFSNTFLEYNLNYINQL